jgi:hypothetical protein
MQLTVSSGQEATNVRFPTDGSVGEELASSGFSELVIAQLRQAAVVSTAFTTWLRHRW